jgi:hypothetical protein
MNDEVMLCPTCATENDALNKTCTQCGQSLIVVCPRCNIINPFTAEQCFACGQHFDTLGQIMARHELRQGDRFTRQAVGAIEIQQAEKAGEQARSDQLWEKDHQRQAALIAQKQEQQRQEKQLITGAISVAVVVIVLLIIFAATR